MDIQFVFYVFLFFFYLFFICFNRPNCRAVSVFRRKRKRFAVSKEQNMAVYGMYDPL